MSSFDQVTLPPLLREIGGRETPPGLPARKTLYILTAFVAIGFAIILVAVVAGGYLDGAHASDPALLGALAVGLVAFAYAATRQLELSRKLNHQVSCRLASLTAESHMPRVLDCLPIGLLVLSTDLRVMLANRFALEALRLSPQDTLGRRVSELMQVQGLAEQASNLVEYGNAGCCRLSAVTVGCYEPGRQFHVHVARIETSRATNWLLLILDNFKQPATPQFVN